MSTVRSAAGFAPWIQYARHVPGDGMVLLCVPHAAGAASAYRGWITALADHGIEVWPVQLPGRETRFSEPLATDLAMMTSTVADLLHESLSGRPYAIYGHSAGAMVAYGLALRAAAGGQPGPQQLFVGACRPPSRPDPDFPIHQLADAPFLARLVGYGRIPPEILGFPDMMEQMIATARADLQLVETYPWRPDMVVHCPVTAFGGVADAAVPAEILPDWGRITSGAFQSVVLPGGHFPGPSAEQQLLEVIRRDLC